MFDRFFKDSSPDDPHPLAKGLRRLMAKGYAPCAQEMLRHNIAVDYKPMPETVGANVFLDFATNNVTLLEINETTTGYALEPDIEHEGAHYTQWRFYPKRFSPLYVRPLDSYKALRVCELDAWARTGYKIAADYMSGHIGDADFSAMADSTVFIVPMVVSIWAGTPESDNKTTVLATMQEMKQSGKQKSEHDILPEFYRRGAPHWFFQDAADQAIANTNEAFHWITQNSRAGRYQRRDRADLFSANFDLTHADKLLNRHGGNPLGRLTQGQRDEFWVDIGRLTPAQNAQILSQQLRAQYLA